MYTLFYCRSGDLETRLTAIEKDLEENIENLSSVQEQFSACKSENKSLHAEMAVINQVSSICTRDYISKITNIKQISALQSIDNGI